MVAKLMRAVRTRRTMTTNSALSKVNRPWRIAHETQIHLPHFEDVQRRIESVVADPKQPKLL